MHFDVDVLIETLRLSWQLQSIRNDTIDSVINRATAIVCGSGVRNAVSAALSSGKARVPRRSMLLDAAVKIDVYYSLYQRQRTLLLKGFRIDSQDSSPQSGFNILCSRTIEYQWPKTMSVEDIAASDWSLHRVERYLVLSSLGYGAGNTLHRARNYVHKKKLEAGSSEAFDQVCDETIGYVSDQGTDANVRLGC